MPTIPELPAGPRRLGKSDLVVGPLSWGMWRFAEASVAEARERVEAALDAGLTLLDTADIYGGDGAAESLLGRVLREAPALRERMVLATKGGIVPGVPYDSSAAYLREACEASLSRLGVERVDLYQVHRPDWLAHPEAVAGVLAGLRQEGKIREVGVSNHTTAGFDALQAHLPFPIATHQPEMSAWCLDPLRDGVLDQCMQHGVTPLAWSPLAGGALALAPEQALSRPGGERLAALIRTLDRIASERGASRAAVALSFLIAHPAGVIPIVGSQRPERIRASVEALGIPWTRSDWYDVVEASQGEALP